MKYKSIFILFLLIFSLAFGGIVKPPAAVKAIYKVNSNLTPVYTFDNDLTGGKISFGLLTNSFLQLNNQIIGNVAQFTSSTADTLYLRLDGTNSPTADIDFDDNNLLMGTGGIGNDNPIITWGAGATGASTFAGNVDLGGNNLIGDGDTYLDFATTADTLDTYVGSALAQRSAEAAGIITNTNYGQILTIDGTAAIPAIGAISNPDLGIIFSGNEINFTINNSIQWNMANSYFQGFANYSARISSVAATATFPIFSFRGTEGVKYGLGGLITSNYISLIAKNIEGIRIAENSGVAAMYLHEITTPTAIVNMGSIYPKSDNKLYFQDGAGNEKTIQTAATAYGEMHVTGGAPFTIDVSGEWHGYTELSADQLGAPISFGASASGSDTTAYATHNGGAETKITTTAAHPFTAGDICVITGSTTYDGIYTVTEDVDANNFAIDTAFGADDTTNGTYTLPDRLIVGVSGAGDYAACWGASGSSATADTYTFGIYVNVAMDHQISRKFPVNDIGAWGGSGIITLAVGDVVWFAILNSTGTANIDIDDMAFAMNIL